MARGGNPRIYMKMDVSDVQRGTRKAEHALKQLDRAGSRSFKGLSASAKGLSPHLVSAVAGFTSLAGAVALVKDAVGTTEDLAKGTALIARTTGESTEEASRWVAVAKVRGVEAKTLNRSFVQLSKAIVAANDGSKKQADLFKKLGVAQADLKKGDVSTIMGDLADAFERMPNGAQKAAAAQQLFGKNAATLLPLLNKGSEALREQLNLSDQYGTTLSKKQVAEALKAAEAQRKLNLSMMGLKVALGSAVIPALTSGVNALTKFIGQVRTGEGAGGKFAAKVKEIWQNVKPTIEGFGKLAANIGKFVAKHPEAQKVAAALVAVGLAVKTISFASQITGIGRLLKLTGQLGSVGAKGGTALAENVAGYFFPNWARKSGGIKNAIKNVFTSAGKASGESFSTSAAQVVGQEAAGKIERSGAKGRIAAVFGRIGKLAGAAMKAALLAAITEFAANLEKKLADWAAKIAGFKGDINDRSRDPLNNILPDLGPLNPLVPGRRRGGGFVYRAGGVVPAMISSGEVVVEPDGRAWRAPGAPVAADNVPAMLRPGSAVLTWDGQARMAAGASLPQAVAMQAPHFRSGGFATPTKVGASMFTTNGESGGYRGTLNSHPWAYAELSKGYHDWSALGGLPLGYKLAVTYGNRTVVAGKHDVGQGGGPVGGYHRAIDLLSPVARYLKLPGLGVVTIQSTSAPEGTKGPAAFGGRARQGTRPDATDVSPSKAYRLMYKQPSGGSGRIGQAAWDAGWQAGIDDPFGYGLARRQTDFYNDARGGIFGTWSRVAVPSSSSSPTPGVRRRYPLGWQGIGQGRAAAVAAAKSQVGHREGAAGNAASFARMYQRAAGMGVGPYCGAFVAWAAQKGGARTSSGWTYVPNYLGNMTGIVGHSRKASDAQPGDALTMRGNSHVEMVAGPARGNTIPTIGGNTTGGGQGPEGVYFTNRSQWDTIAKVAYPKRRGGWVQRFAGGGVVKGPHGMSLGIPVGSKVAGTWSGAPRHALKDAQDQLGRLISIGIGRGEQPKVNAALNRALTLINRLDYGQAKEFVRVARNFWQGIRGPNAQTMRARIAPLIRWGGSRLATTLSRPIGVSDSVQAAIGDEGGLLDDRLTVSGIDPSSKEGIQARIDFDIKSIGRLEARKKRLREALRRTRPGSAERRAIQAEIKDVDRDILGFRADMVRQRKAILTAPTNAELQAGGDGTGGGGSADLQAQLDQANTRATVAQRSANLSEAFIRSAFGSGDIGSGGSYAWTAAGGAGAAFNPGMSITINTLHPGDPQTLQAIGAAATAGMGLQGFTTSPRSVSGV